MPARGIECECGILRTCTQAGQSITARVRERQNLLLKVSVSDHARTKSWNISLGAHI